MATRRKLNLLINQAVQGQPINKAFLTDLMQAIEMEELANRKPPSKSYKPSSFVCMRQMYYGRIGEPPEKTRGEYNGIGMANTGSLRHDSIQKVLLQMENLGYDWRYIDVAQYVSEKQANGKLMDLDVVGTRGAETKLYDHVLHMSFMCDGIIQQISTGKYFLFEFKNQVSFKYNGKESVDKEHVAQVSAYCTCLDLEDVFVVYEHRDLCFLECPELFVVTKEMKQELVIDRILECEGYVERLVHPPRSVNPKICRWCKYKTACDKVGDTAY